ncbi:MAG: ABC-2 family transporter protein [Deltaproteobacteria bacterium]|nr:ABC-2 family transporter protein [Deltaproteobacteria bacterium]
MSSQKRIFMAFLRIAYANLLHARINFFAIVAYWAVSLGVLIVFWKTLFQFLPVSIGVWNFPRLCILNSFCYISWGVFVFFWGMHRIPEKVVAGQLDKFLSRPIHPLLGLVGEELNLIGVYEVIAGLAALITICIHYAIYPNFVGVLLSTVALVLGTLGIVIVHGVVSLFSFWLGRVDAIQGVLDHFDEFQRYPIDFYSSWLQKILKYIVPIYFPGTFAARIFLNLTVHWSEWLLLFIVLSVWVGIFIFLYRKCMVRYEANG